MAIFDVTLSCLVSAIGKLIMEQLNCSALSNFILLVFDCKEKETVAICLQAQEVATEIH